MTAEIQTVFRRHLRLQIEPIEVELDGSEGNLLFATLQSAFPGCSGLFYYNEKTNSKSAVKFDGAKFVPPEGDWRERDYYVQLGSRCAFPFGSYENASKQFERSVNLVSKLMSGKRTTQAVMYDERITKKERHSPVERIDGLRNMIQNIQLVKQEPPSTPPTTPIRHHSHSEEYSQTSALQRTAAELEANYSNLTPLEQQFVDLARISTAKDSIIETQRTELRQLNDKLQAIKRKAKETKDEVEKAESRCRAQQEELEMLRNLGKEQSYMCERVNDLTKRLIEAKDENDRSVSELTAKIELEMGLRGQVEADNADKNEQIHSLEKELDMYRKEKQEYIERLGDLNIKLEQQANEFATASEDGASLQDNLLFQNTDLLEKLGVPFLEMNEALQKKCEELTSKCLEMESIWNQKIQEAIQNEVQKNTELIDESSAQEKKVAELSSMLDQMIKENNELLRRFDVIKHEKDELRRSSAMLESRVKDNLSKSVIGSPLRY